MYYDKYGKQLELFEWANLFENKEYKRIGSTKLWWGGWVSTVWLGLDHSFNESTPLTFETMVFGWKRGSEVDMVRYSGLADARNGHEEMVDKWKNPLRIWFRRLVKEVRRKFKF